MLYYFVWLIQIHGFSDYILYFEVKLQKNPKKCHKCLVFNHWDLKNTLLIPLDYKAEA